jgi:hypothetical protein
LEEGSLKKGVRIEETSSFSRQSGKKEIEGIS